MKAKAFKILKGCSYWFKVVTVGVVLGFSVQFVRAWTEPSDTPPNANVGAPLNTSSTGQTKAGGLVLNSGGADNGLIVQSGNVGIGTASPTAKLDVNGDALINGFTLGRGSSGDESNSAFGKVALANNTTGVNNTTMGIGSLQRSTTGFGNTALGAYALTFNSSGYSNTAVGESSLQRNTTGNYNSAMGSSALFDNTSGTNNVAVGHGALQSNTTGNTNVAVGNAALFANTDGTFNTAVGHGAFDSATNYSNSTAIGYNAQPTASNMIRLGNTNITRIEGQVGFSETSDRRLKKEITDSDLGLDFISKLRPVSFKKKSGDDGIDYGFIAQEVEAAVGKSTNIVMTANDEAGTKTMRYTDLIAPLVKAVQEQQKQIEELRAQIEMLKNDKY